MLPCMGIDDCILLGAQRRALAHWRALNRVACIAEAQVLRASMQQALGEGEGPSPALRELAAAARAEANAWRDATPLDFSAPHARSGDDVGAGRGREQSALDPEEFHPRARHPRPQAQYLRPQLELFADRGAQVVDA